MTWETDLKAAPSDSEAALRVLGHAAEFMRRGEALPSPLAEYIAGALEAAAVMERVTGTARARVLGIDLNLVGKRGRKKTLSEDERHHRLDRAGFDGRESREKSVFAKALKPYYRRTSIDNLYKSVLKAEDQEAERRAAIRTEWNSSASPEQRAVLAQHQIMCSHDFAVMVLNNPARSIQEIAADLRQAARARRYQNS